MNRTALAVTGLLAAACANPGAVDPLYEAPAATTTPGAETYEEAQAQVQADLEALSDLELFVVGQLVVTSDMMPGMCYGPCPDDDARRAAFVEQANRLHTLVDLADDDIATLGPCYVRADDPGVVAETLGALDALQIVDVGELIVEEAQPDPMCYNLPCPDEVERVERANLERAERAWHLAQRSDGL